MNLKAYEEVEPLPSEDRDGPYRRYVAEVILSYASQNGTLRNTDAYRQIMAVTDRSQGAVKNWLTYRNNFPDMASVARVFHHWKIPADALFPSNLEALLAGNPNAPSTFDLGRNVQKLDQLVIPLRDFSSAQGLNEAFARYGADPKGTVFIRHDGIEMLDQIRPGELLLVDPSCEQIRRNGMFLLRLSTEGQPDKNCVRFVEMLMGESAIRLSCGSAMPLTSVETIPLIVGNLPAHIAVLGRVVAVLRQT